MTNPASSSSRFYLTTPIYYVNARPHLGHAYSTIVCDAIARRKRALGIDSWFLTGTDEHGQKIERSAAVTGETPLEFATRVSGEFRGLWDRLGLSYDDFIRTTEARHKRGVQKLFATLRDRGFIYKGSYTGQYCVSDEAYVDGPPGTVCPDCGRVTETVSEENYFFKLSAFERKLLEFYEANPGFMGPESTRREVISFVRGGLKDLSVSRTSFSWGIPVPDDERHVIYVWLDALANYITALGYGSDDAADKARFEKFWPADLHLIGKEISRFHCVYWPAFLMAAGIPLPRSVRANGWLLFDQGKMSKSKGNIVRAETVHTVLGSDALRYYLLREIPFGQDGTFSFEALVQRYNSDLANGYGNLVSRVVNMVHKYFGGIVPEAGAPTAAEDVLRESAVRTVAGFELAFDEMNFSEALKSLWDLVAETDGCFRRLFGGGRGELRLVDPSHILESGIEIYAQPPGKKLEAISLLSGGEKTLTAIALLFATYMVRPSPFCFLDEIDAALDEQNVSRFVNLLREFGRMSQFVVITHNKKTVTGANALLGVTMEDSGVTKVIAVRLERSDGLPVGADGKPVPVPDSIEALPEEEVEFEHGSELPPEPEARGAVARDSIATGTGSA